MKRIALTLALVAIGGFAICAAFDKEAAVAMFMEKANNCLAEVGAAQSDIDEILKKLPATTEEGKCLRACIMKKMGIMNANGKLDPQAARVKAKEYTANDPDKMKIVDEIGAVCGALSVPDDHCAAAEVYGKCLKEQAKQHGIPLD
ncbi:general odorant-binding protein 28a [Scaptodrosophila lebanonensis]|uniref:General odorant-binding protein 28a n=1 Tax=Drosophila lebanonensis TaxID=7225 RepID=A0A6J2TP99_DROLE|nr:general odorant-binding protein 28a [Scaptodrosophila lebanonensis]